MSVFAQLKRRNVVRVGIAYLLICWALLQGADFLLDLAGAPEWVIRVFAVAAVCGLPIVLFLAWAFELTPEGLKREKDVDRTQPMARRSGRKLDFVIIGLLLLVIAMMVAERMFDVEDPAPSDAAAATESTLAQPVADAAPRQVKQESVAVLPFRAMSSGQDDGYFADGLTEELLNVLSALPELLVTARTSSFHFKDKDLPIPEIAAILGVDYVVEGSVRRAGDTVRITAQLVRATDGFHLWSKTYDRTLEDVFAVQEDIATAIAETLDVVLDANKRERMRAVGIGDVEAFIAMQKGIEAFERAHANMRDIGKGLAEARPYFERVLASAPEHIGVRVLMADEPAHRVMDLASGTRPEAYPGEARDALAALQAEYQEAWQRAAPGNQRDILDVERTLAADDWTGFGDKIRRALGAGQCVQASYTLEVATPGGFQAAALQKVREQLRCDPLDAINRHLQVVMLVWNGQPEAALAEVGNAISLGLSPLWMEDALFLTLLSQGRADDPQAQGPAGPETWMRFPREILALAMQGDAAAARAMAEQYWSRPDADDHSSLIVAASIGDRARANRYAARIDGRPGGSQVLLSSAFECACGAPFDVEAAPVFRRKLAQSGLSWPPAAPLQFPDKDW